MKTFAMLVTILIVAAPVFAADYVDGYYRKDGTYVNGHWKSERDNSYNNNYSTQGNYNPYTGNQGTNSQTWNDRTPQQNINTYGNPGYVDQYPNGSIYNNQRRR